MHLAPADWNTIESILARTETLDAAEERLAFGKRILGDGPMRRSFFAGLVRTNGIETFATLWNAAIKSIDDCTITTNYLRALERLSIRAIDKQWLQSMINGEEPEDLDVDPPPVAPANPAPAAQPPANNPAAPIHHAHADVNFGINANQVHIQGGVHLGPGQPAMESGDDNPQAQPAVRFTIRQASKITATTRTVKATLVREDPAARITRTEVEVKIAVPTEEQKDQIANYFNPDKKLIGDPAHKVQGLMKSLGEKLFEDCFATKAASNELSLCLHTSRKLEFVVEGAPAFHSIPWELMRFVFTNRPMSKPIVDMYPIFRHVVDPPDFHALPPHRDAPLHILWISARLPHDSICRGAVLAPVRAALTSSNVIIDEVLSGSFLDMKQKLQEHREERKYHVLHLDMHGVVMSPAELRSRFGADSNWVLDARDGGLGNLPRSTDDVGFLAESTFAVFNQGSKSVPVSADELGAALAFGGVPLVALNACHSADVIAEDASMVARLVQSGGYPAVGFQHPLTVTGAVLFFTNFYQSLTTAKKSMDIQQAVHAGRQALRNQSNRGSRPIEDWHLPSFYTLPGVSRI